jgi:hypothetical protein
MEIQDLSSRLKKLTITAEFEDEIQIINPQKPAPLITGEIMMTSGPRKTDDNPLGEDAAGIILCQDHAAFWVADGTSESPNILSYNSRTMAQTLGIIFTEIHQEIGPTKIIEGIQKGWNVPEVMLKKALSELRQEWQQKLRGYIENPQRRKHITEAFKIDEETAKIIKKRHLETIDFSTTFMCGIITNQGKGQIASIGDGPLCIKTKQTSDIKVYRPKSRRIFLRLRKNGQKTGFDELQKNIEVGTKTFTDADLIIAGSDGVGQLPEHISRQSKNMSWKEIRRQVSSYAPKKYDDKTFCVIQIKE